MSSLTQLAIQNTSVAYFSMEGGLVSGERGKKNIYKYGFDMH
jgi:hypothetical protein